MRMRSPSEGSAVGGGSLQKAGPLPGHERMRDFSKDINIRKGPRAQTFMTENYELVV